DDFWVSDSAYPADLVISSEADGLAMLAAELEKVNESPETIAYREVTDNSELVQGLHDRTLGLDWVKVTMVSDDPAKGLGKIDEDQLMINRLSAILTDPVKSLDLVSAYFIPGDVLTGYLTGLAENGVRVRTLTNSQEATDVLPVHSGYLLYRGDLLDGGVDVYELKSRQKKMRIFSKFSILGASATSLHAKTFTLDGERIFIGSFNFDPRSAMLNSEMGLLIESPKIASLLTGYFDKGLDQTAYQVIREQDGGTVWVETDSDGNTTLLDSEPLTTAFTRGLVKFIGWLPVIWIL
ncbi:MAG: phospholipase D-like domain-containing protein, partial [Paracoccaceae bacterium]